MGRFGKVRKRDVAGEEGMMALGQRFSSFQCWVWAVTLNVKFRINIAFEVWGIGGAGRGGSSGGRVRKS